MASKLSRCTHGQTKCQENENDPAVSFGVSAISSHLIIAQKNEGKEDVAKAYTSLSTALNQTESRKVQVSAPTTPDQ